MAEATPTRFIIFEPVDETNLLWRIAGSVLANGRDQAENYFYKGGTAEVVCAPVSEHAWQPRTHIPKVVQQARREPVVIDYGSLPTGADPLGPAPSSELAEPDPTVENLDPEGLDNPAAAVDGVAVDALADAELAADRGEA